MSLKVNVRSVLLAAFGCVSLRASVIANASISLDSFTIMPSAGALTLVNPWMAMAFAQGQNSLGENPQDSKGPGLTANAAVMATYVTASGSADATNAEMLAAGGSSKVDIPGMVLAAANGTGRGTLFTTFEITGGTGPVSVAYFANITSTLDLSTGAFGQLAQGEDIFNLQRDGNSIPGLFNDFFHSIGPGDSPFNNTMPLTLSGTETLQYNTPYFLLLEVDAESRGINGIPEPATLWLVFGPLGLFVAGRRLRIFHRYLR